MVIKKLFKFIIFFIFICFGKLSYSSQILDYETERFVNSLILKIKTANNINKNIKYKILANDNINAFVDITNTIHITSGLIENSPDYVALLSVIAHEIGHIDKNHITIRSKSINKLNNYKNLSTISIIAGSMISNSPELIQGIALSNAGLADAYIGFSKEQEIEADIYSLNTLKRLKISSISIVELLEIIEKKALKKGFTKEKQRISTHPYFDDRIDLINFVNNNNEKNFDDNQNIAFNFIQAKFIGYNGNVIKISQLDEPYKSYAESIYHAKNGNLIESLRKINKIILDNKENLFLLETKAEILFSNGYIDESVKFYEKVVNKYPDNNYAKIRILSNLDMKNMTKEKLNNIFLENMKTLKKNYNNSSIVYTYSNLSKLLNKKEWINFFEFWMNKNNDKNNIIKNLEKLSKTDDKNLLNLIEHITKDIT